jgi:hypothetical protein
MKSRIFSLAAGLLSMSALLADPLAPIDPAKYRAPVKVACVGDSITQGSGAGPGKSYPAQLQGMLGDKWKVGNFGVSGRTLLKKGDFPYWKEKKYQEALAQMLRRSAELGLRLDAKEPQAVDSCLEELFDALFFDGEDASVGHLMLAAWQQELRPS